MKELPEYMIAMPTVFAVGNKYNIFVPFSDEVIMWVRVGDKTYYDHCNGILRSNTRMHRVELPASVLDAAKEYTVVYKKMIDRTPYFPKSEDERSLTVPFRPVKDGGDINVYHIADAHNLTDEPIIIDDEIAKKIPCDGILSHNRKIITPLDDSVVSVVDGEVDTEGCVTSVLPATTQTYCFCVDASVATVTKVAVGMSS